MSLALHAVAAHVNDAGGVGRPLRGVDLLAVVFGVVGYLARDVALGIGRGLGHPQVAPAVDICLPCRTGLAMERPTDRKCMGR